MTLPLSPPSPKAAIALRLLEKITTGSLILTTPDGTVHRFGNDDTCVAELHIHDWGVIDRTLASGDVGFGLGYIDGQWDTSDLFALLSLFIQNRTALEGVVYGSWWGQLLYRLQHWRNRNTRAGSVRNILAHYDLGNDFYQLWLDPSMNYSSALFEPETAVSLEAAQWAKIARALDQVHTKAGDRVLEIGCGWGALAEMAAAQHSAHVTGLTLSPSQQAYGLARLKNKGLAADLRLQDYRDFANQVDNGEIEKFDAIVSIEMFEAVGQAYWASYFDCIKSCLKQGGKACIQSIVIRDDLFDRYIRGTDFIQQCVFPGGCLPSQQTFIQAAQDKGLRVVDTFAFGQSYAKTLALWRTAFNAKHADISALGFDERFMRLWNFYLVYCQAAFAQGNINLVQFTLEHA